MPRAQGAVPLRRLVLCLDGTWNSPNNEKKRETGESVLKPTNVLKLCRSVLPRDRHDPAVSQIAYYDTGVGSLGQYPGAANRLLHVSDRLFGGAWGAGFEANVEDVLHFLTLNLQPGDEVYLFGFSRGAATARAATHFVDWLGGLPVKGDAYYLPKFFEEYVRSHGRRSSTEIIEGINRQRANRKPRPQPPLEPLQEVNVRFLGVWDTVAALGSRFRTDGKSTSAHRQSFLVRSIPAACVRVARQALAIDEARLDFRPEVWLEARAGQSLKQRWFAGVHSNIGGGYLDDGLANLAFQWMRKEVEAEGLALDGAYYNHFGGNAMDRLYRSENAMYRILDAARRHIGRGRRDLGAYPIEAKLELDRSVIWRLQADPEEEVDGHGGQPVPRYPEMRGRPYRPRNLLQFLGDFTPGQLDHLLRSLDPPLKEPVLTPELLREIADVSSQRRRRRVP